MKRRLVSFIVLLLLLAPIIRAQESTPEITPEPTVIEAASTPTAESTAEITPEVTDAPEKTDEPAGTPTPRTEFIAYGWETGDLAIFVPSDAQISDDSSALTAQTDDGSIHYSVLDFQIDIINVDLYSLLETAMLNYSVTVNGLTLTTYERLTLWGRPGWRVDGIDYATGLLARGRIGRLPNERVLIIIVTASDETTLARRADAATYGLVFGANSTPRIPATFPPDRVGNAALRARVPVQGTVSALNPTQQWTFDGREGDIVSFTAVDLARTQVFDPGLDMAIRVFNPDGTEFGYNDDQVGTDLFGAYDAILAEVTLTQTGIYTVQIEWVAGAGIYTLGVSADVLIAVASSAIAAPFAVGSIDNIFTFQRFVFEATAGQTATITMTATAGDLDPTLEVFMDDGRSLAFNDDAEDITLGTNAQLMLTFPTDGSYVLEAGRFSGVGEYEITVAGS